MASILKIPGDIIVRHIVPHLEARDLFRLLLTCHYMTNVLQFLEFHIDVNSSGRRFTVFTSRPVSSGGVSLLKKLPNVVLHVQRPSIKGIQILQPLIDSVKRFSFEQMPNHNFTVCCILRSLPADCVSLKFSFEWDRTMRADARDDMIAYLVMFLCSSRGTLTSLDLPEYFSDAFIDPRVIHALAACSKLEHLRLPPVVKKLPDGESFVQPLSQLTQLTSLEWYSGMDNYPKSFSTNWLSALMLHALAGACSRGHTVRVLAHRRAAGSTAGASEHRGGPVSARIGCGPSAATRAEIKILYGKWSNLISFWAEKNNSGRK